MCSAPDWTAVSIIQCFDWRVLKLVQKLAPEIATGALTDQQGSDDTVYAGAPGASPWLAGLEYQELWRLGAKARARPAGPRSGRPTTSMSRAAAVAEAHGSGPASDSVDGERADGHAAAS